MAKPKVKLIEVREMRTLGFCQSGFCITTGLVDHFREVIGPSLSLVSRIPGLEVPAGPSPHVFFLLQGIMPSSSPHHA